MARSVLIRNGMIITQDRDRRVLQGDVLVEGGLIAEVGKVRGGADVEIDAKGAPILPGLINAHCHVAMTVMKGMVDDLPFGEFLDRTFSIDSDRQDDDLLAGSRLGCLEMLMGGTTTFVDLYYSQDVIARAVKEAGMRGVLCWAVLDQQFTTQRGVPLENCKAFHSRYAGDEHILPGIGLQGVYVCSEETFMGARAFSDRTGALMTFHLSETRKEVYEHKAKTGKRPADWLASIGFLNERCLAAHSAWLTIGEVRALAKAGASIATCPVSNMKLATGGVAPIPEMLREGVKVTIGTDGSTTNNSLDMFGEMKALALLQKASRWDPTVVPAQEALDFATVSAAAALGLEREIGSIEVGKRADIVIMDHASPAIRPLTKENAVSNMVYSAGRGDVRSVLCYGNVVIKDRVPQTLDLGQVIEDAQGAMAKIAARVG
ncbi:MAG: amidohydrolase family protein [Methanomassiliicoccales archaeon]|nr:amidohydrolase family protein [Methanomassiliicoccales archaeon]MCE5261368.1 amidohydrolase family protein [Euryarchaeota archaeon]HOO03465.1 amidohydrolase family protein [Methanomassiliicoccales archaeon]HRR66603.1 amidohydrolase family protein [Methanomassiliicoccales archaeon]